MINTLIGRKINQAQDFLENGRRIPVTEISVVDNVVLQVKSLEKDGYVAAQLGFDAKKNPPKALLGHAKKQGVDRAPSKIHEIRLDGVGGDDLPKSGEVLTVDSIFKSGDIVQISGTSKGKGFAGVVRRYNFRGGPKTHGQSDRHRAPGSIGQSTTPGRVYKGKRMAGRMGTDKVTIKNLVVVDVDIENKKLFVTGLVPGNKNGVVVIEKIGEKKKYVPLVSAKEAESEKPVEELEAEEKVAEKIEVEKAEESVEEKKTEEVVKENEEKTEEKEEVK